ncbi:MAG TPA: hypothetical protein VFQ45_10700 [Longimicrobium sp.]|nr:hypothetical protein [Longimicrobium sp.]
MAYRHYDYGLRGYRETAPRPRPVGTHYDAGYHGGDGGYDRGYQGGAGYDRGYGSGGRGYDRGYHGRPEMPNRVTLRYNRDYVRPGPDRYPVNYNPYGGDREQRVGDMTAYWRPYATSGGSRTWRGGGQPVGWEREADHRRYDRDFRGYGRDYYGPMR